MQLAGVPVRDPSILELARLLRDAGFEETAERLENAYDSEVKVLALTIPEREEILRALEECPPGLRRQRLELAGRICELAELRAVLLQEHTWRRREGLV